MVTRERKSERLTALSDGVFAAIMTLQVLELKPPHAASLVRTPLSANLKSLSIDFEQRLGMEHG